MAGSKGGKGRSERNQALLTGLRHELRRRILILMRDGREISPSEIAEEMGEVLSNVAYHVRVLALCEAVEGAGDKPVRGATQHFYRFALKPKWALALLDEEAE